MGHFLFFKFIVTVHVNLWWRDCPQSGAAHRTGLRTTPKAGWEDTNTWNLLCSGAFASMLQELKSGLKDMSYSYCHSYPIAQSFIQDPEAYGTASLS